MLPLHQQLLDMVLVSVAVVGLALFLSEFAKTYPGKFGGYTPNAVSSSVTSAFICIGALYIFGKRAPEEVETRAPIPEGDDSLPDFPRKQHWTMDPTAEVEIGFAKKGFASYESCPPSTVIAAFEALLQQPGKSEWVALAIERPVPLMKDKGVAPSLPPEEWTTWSYGDYYREATLVAQGFVHFGLEMYGCVAIWGFNAPEWHMAVISAIFSGAKAAGIYPTDSIDQVKYKLRHSGSAILVVEDSSKLDRILSIKEDLPDLRLIVTIESSAAIESRSIECGSGNRLVVISWKGLCSLANDAEDIRKVNERKQAVKPGNCCALVYTSGTTGNPKAVMISYDNVVYACHVLAEIYRGRKIPEQVRLLSYLPLSHIAGMLVDIFLPIIYTYKKNFECTTFFARSYDLKEGTLRFRLQFVRPTFFLAVPRVYEKIAEKLREIGSKTRGIKRTIATWAKSKGFEHAIACQLGGDGSYPPMYALAENVILKMIKQQLGLNDAIFCVSAAAPITMDIIQYFASLSVPILEMYGMSESTGATSMNTVNTKMWGSCGFALEGAEVAILATTDGSMKRCPYTTDIFNPREEEQGEICYRGRHIMMGYMANASLGAEHVAEIAQKNSEAIDEFGWLHSGDMGTMDVNGMLRITGRYKELIIGAGGENIAPVPIEDYIKCITPEVSNAMMVGDKRKYNVVLITLKAVGATGELAGTNVLAGTAADLNPKISTTEEAAQDPAWQEYLTKIMQRVNKNPSVVASSAYTIQKFAILPHDFSVEGGEFTPTFKVRRSEVVKMWAHEIDKLYA